MYHHPNNSPYICKERRSLVFHQQEAWTESIIDHVLTHARSGGAALVICKYIHQVDTLHTLLKKQYEEKKLFTYTGAIEQVSHSITEDSTSKDKEGSSTQEATISKVQKGTNGSFTKKEIFSGEILLATNIAGRGTDISTTPEVESHGGLYVCSSVLPETYRVELQNAGRTARKGNKGSFQFILFDDQGNSIETLKASRKIQEEASIQKARQDVAKKIREDRLFSAFCSLEEELLPKAKDVEKQTQRNLLEKAWEITKRSNLNPSKLSNDFNKCVDSYLSRIISNLSAENQEVYSTPTKCKELRQGILSTPNFQSVSSPEAWRKHRKKTGGGTNI